jgi:hypothetical protein
MQSKQVVCKVCGQTVQAVQTTMAQGGDKRFTVRQSARYFTIRPHKQQNNGGRSCDGSGRRA